MSSARDAGHAPGRHWRDRRIRWRPPLSRV